MTQLNMRYTTYPEAQVVVHAPRAVPMEEWQTYVDHCVERPFEAMLVLAAAGFPGLDGAQRRYIGEGWKRRTWGTPRMALITTSTTHLALLTALNWFNNDAIRAFSPARLDSAMAYLGCDEALAQRLLDEAKRLSAELDLPSSLQAWRKPA